MCIRRSDVRISTLSQSSLTAHDVLSEIVAKAMLYILYKKVSKKYFIEKKLCLRYSESVWTKGYVSIHLFGMKQMIEQLIWNTVENLRFCRKQKH